MQIAQESKKVIAAVIEQAGKVLIAQRAKNDALKGKREFPGGKLEAGETFEQCLRRELNEELGIDAHVGDYLCTSPFYHNGVFVEMVVFWVPSFTGQITLKEHQAIRWVAPKDLMLFDFPEPDMPIIKLLLDTSDPNS